MSGEALTERHPGGPEGFAGGNNERRWRARINGGRASGTPDLSNYGSAWDEAQGGMRQTAGWGGPVSARPAAGVAGAYLSAQQVEQAWLAERR